MVRIDILRDDDHKSILRCSEGKSIWYQIWITQLDMNCIERYFDGYGEVILCLFIDIAHDTNPYKNIINQATRIKI